MSKTHLSTQPHWVFINELGDNLGHIALLKTYSQAARQAGIRISFILPDLKKSLFLELNINDDLFQAPTTTFAKARSTLQPSTLAEGLLLAGYSQTKNLALSLSAWRSLLKSLQPDCIIYDYAPTAKLASEGLPCYKVAIGSPYCVIPDNANSLVLPNQTTTSERIEKSEQQCLTSINKALVQLQLPSLKSLAALGDYDAKYILGTQELDCFRAFRQSEEYVGFLKPSLTQQTLPWAPRGNKPKIFAYLSTRYPFLESLINLLKAETYSLIILSGPKASTYTALANEHCQITNSPIAIEDALKRCDAVIHHGGFNLMGQTLLYQRANLCIPLHIEQLSNCHQLVHHNLGTQLLPAKNWANQVFTIKQFLAHLKITPQKIATFDALDADIWVKKLLKKGF